MKEMSLYKEVFKDVDGEVEQLGNDISEEKLNSFSLKYETKVPQLEKMCYIMEKVLLQKKTEGVVYAGFQKVSRAEDIWDRFRQIADNVDKVYIFGEHDKDLTPHPNVEFIYLPKNHSLTKEWFLVIDRPLAKSMMVAYDMDGFYTEDLKDRNFKGAKSTNPNTVKKAVDLLDQLI
ncbi:putative sensor protein [Natranaerobius thermophilus JW/NM-WN-LF]|uniref:Putative sensor protein n=2 Tax=Natranaerobius TaxID=375928 RepID=B2A2Y0_NATTJ|nr:putative sensor protein [Natranaerobius thermophilus JW/NM-WN-LF]